MSRHIQAYFRTEDDAEGAKIRLAAYPLEHLEAGRLEEGMGRNRNILIPILPFGTITGMYAGGVSTLGSIPAVFAAHSTASVADAGETGAQRDIREDRPEDDNDTWGTVPLAQDTFGGDGSGYEDLKYVLSAKVKDVHFEEVVNKLRSEGAFVEILD
ncbi:hypothetical protein [Paenibacillus caui]|uniref:hypothetical protein n=1 Tax=Paenibacillus caui TaxID=2873927 RepID=UPI001CA92EA1|nr:hypothetical protein [Paenibacillus caui]